MTSLYDFKTTYRDAVSGIETVHIDVDSVLDEARRKRLRAHRSRQKLITMAVMGGILCICTFGTVQVPRQSPHFFCQISPPFFFYDLCLQPVLGREILFREALRMSEPCGSP